MEKKQFKIALPTDVKRWVAIEAAKSMRSQTAEIILALREKMEAQNEKSGTTA